MRKVAIIQARMGSTRLPGKVLKKVLDKPLLLYQLERVKRSNLIDEIVVATTDQPIDDEIVSFCSSYHIPCYRGSENDVLRRYLETARKYQADMIIRLTADCPFIDPKIIDRIIQQYIQNKQPLLYVSNTLTRTFPRGMDVEAFSYQALKKAQENAIIPMDREHVTRYIVTNPHMFNLLNVRNEQDLKHHRWTVDTAEDFTLVKKIIEKIYPTNPNFTMKDIIKLLDHNPTWRLINAHVEQKEG